MLQARVSGLKHPANVVVVLVSHPILKPIPSGVQAGAPQKPMELAASY